MKKILVPTDFSVNADKALYIAAEIAANANATLEILHVNTSAAYTPLMPEYAIADDGFDDYAESVSSDLHALKRVLVSQPKFANLTVESRVEDGFLHTTMNRIAQDDNCDLLVMGTKGATGATEFFVGSNTEKVIRTTACPVLVVPQNTKDFNIRTVVLATTLRPDQYSAFETLVEWQKNNLFDVKVLYLNNPGGFANMEAIYTALNEFCTRSGLINAELFTATNTFNEERTILSFADEHAADMIAMATHQRRGISHMMFGSLTEDTANHSDIPVLCIPIHN